MACIESSRARKTALECIPNYFVCSYSEPVPNIKVNCSHGDFDINNFFVCRATLDVLVVCYELMSVWSSERWLCGEYDESRAVVSGMCVWNVFIRVDAMAGCW